MFSYEYLQGKMDFRIQRPTKLNKRDGSMGHVFLVQNNHSIHNIITCVQYPGVRLKQHLFLVYCTDLVGI